MSNSTQVPCVQGPFPSPGAPGGSDSLPSVFCGPGYGYCPAHSPQDLCFPGGASTQELSSSIRISFANDVTVLGRTPAPVHSPDIVLSETSDVSVMKDDDMAKEAVLTDASALVVPPPPGYREFSWPRDDWMVGSETSSGATEEVFPGGSPRKDAGLPVDPPSLPVSPIVLDSTDDSVAVQVGSSREESCVLSGIVGLGLPSTAAPDAALLADSPMEFLIQDLQWAPAAPRPQDGSEGGDRRSASRVPRWRLAREGPFLEERPTSVLRALGAGCAFRRTTYRASDHVWPSGAFGIPLNHPRFLDWVGVPESASLLELGPGQWLDTLSRDQAMAAAIQLHRDVCLMTTNLAYMTLHDVARRCTTLHDVARRCTTLHDVARRCTTLHDVARRCTTLHDVCTTLHDVARRCTTLHDVARRCTTLHDVARRCTTLHDVARRCTTLHDVARRCTTLHDVARRCTTLHDVARRCTTLHDVARRCTTLHDVARRCTTLHDVARRCTKLHDVARRCTTLHDVARRCTTLHDVARRCTTLHDVARRCTTLHDVARRCTTLHDVARRCTTLHDVARRCTTLHDVARRCTTLHDVARRCTTLHDVARRCTTLHDVARRCTTLHDVARRCTTLHDVARRCTTLHDVARRCTTLHDVARRCTTLHDVARRCTTLHDVAVIGGQSNDVLAVFDHVQKLAAILVHMGYHTMIARRHIRRHTTLCDVEAHHTICL